MSDIITENMKLSCKRCSSTKVVVKGDNTTLSYYPPLLMVESGILNSDLTSQMLNLECHNCDYKFTISKNFKL